MLPIHAATMATLELLTWCSHGALIQDRDIERPLQDSYDYIVVGCGISDLVVTNRLSEDSLRIVLCIEAETRMFDINDILAEPILPVTITNLSSKIPSMLEQTLEVCTIGVYRQHLRLS